MVLEHTELDQRQMPVTRIFDVFFDLCMNKRLSRHSRHQWFETPLIWDAIAPLMKSLLWSSAIFRPRQHTYQNPHVNAWLLAVGVIQSGKSRVRLMCLVWGLTWMVCEGNIGFQSHINIRDSVAFCTRQLWIPLNGSVNAFTYNMIALWNYMHNRPVMKSIHSIHRKICTWFCCALVFHGNIMNF